MPEGSGLNPKLSSRGCQSLAGLQLPPTPNVPQAAEWSQASVSRAWRPSRLQTLTTGPDPAKNGPGW